MDTAKGRGKYWGMLAATLSVVGCGGNSVALDGDEPLQVTAGGADGDGVVVRKLRNVGEVLVDDQRLYWQIDSTVYGCLKSTCASSLVNYFTFEPHAWANPVVYEDPRRWWAPQSDDLIWTTWTSVLSCPRAGCDGPPRELGANRPTSNYAVDDVLIVAAERDAIYTMPRAGGDWSLLIRRDGPGIGRLGIHDGYVYWVEQSTGVEEGNLVRVSADGSGSVENVTALAPTLNGVEFAFDSSFVYFTLPRENGGVYRCPLQGCSGGAENALGYAVRSPSFLAADDHGLCVIHEPSPFDPVLGCTSGAAQPLEQRFVHTASFAMDADNLYAANGRNAPGTPYVDPFFDISRVGR